MEGLDLYIRRRTTETDDRRTGAIATGKLRLTLVQPGTKKPLAELMVDADAGAVLFVDELPMQRQTPPGRAKRQRPEDVSSPERVVGPIPELGSEPRQRRPAPLEGRPGLALAEKPQERPQDEAEPEADETAPERRTPASARRGKPGSRPRRPAARKAD